MEVRKKSASQQVRVVGYSPGITRGGSVVHSSAIDVTEPVLSGLLALAEAAIGVGIPGPYGGES